MVRLSVFALTAALAVAVLSSSPLLLAKPDHASKHAPAKLTKKTRLDFLRRAQVWMPTNVAQMDIRTGPAGKDAFALDAMVTCDHSEVKLTGSSRKFDCKTADGDRLKVRYGIANGEVEGSVIASRLLWALGFAADREYPVRVTCRGCSADPWTDRTKASGTAVFDPAVIERKPEGDEMKSSDGAGWAWTELPLVDEAAGGATHAQRDGFILLAVFMQHTDNKAEQQRLLCLPGGVDDKGRCDKPFLAIHDVGLTFGHANYLNRTSTGSVNFQQWSTTPIWRDEERCVGHMSQSSSGTIGDPTISEAGRAFLASLLVQLTDQQIHDLFAVARVEQRHMNEDGSDTSNAAGVDAWAAAFKAKRDQIVLHHCPA
jgi:hypothetical protein